MNELIKDTTSTDYADIDKLIANQNSLLEQQQAQQNDVLNQQMQMQIDQINRNKTELDQNVNKTNSGLYADYKKASNRYGANAENLFTQGLGNSGFAESTQTDLYNTYQKNITETNNTAMKLKADFDNQIADAMKNRNLQQAQFALQLYQQKMNLLTQEYDLKNNKEEQLYNRGIDERNYNYQLNRDTVADTQWEKEYQRALKEAELAELWRQKNYDYQVGRDAVTDNHWNQQFDYQKARDAVSDDQWNQQFNYQKSRDAIADSQWEKEYALSSRKASTQIAKGSNTSNNVINTANLSNTNDSGNDKALEMVRNAFTDTIVGKLISEGKDEQAYKYLLKHS